MRMVVMVNLAEDGSIAPTVYAMLVKVFRAFSTSIFIHQFFINISLRVLKKHKIKFWHFCKLLSTFHIIWIEENNTAYAGVRLSN